MQLPKRKPGKYSQIPFDPVMSEEKFQELEIKLERLKKKQPVAAREVSRLAEMGDFSENVEYQLAKRRLRGINYGIMKLEHQINHAEIVEVSDSDVVQLGSTVNISSNKGERTYKILGASEVDPDAGIISHQSPLGSALLGHVVGDVVEVEKIGNFEILAID